MTFFLGLATINTVGWLAVAGIAAAKGCNAAAPTAPTFSQQNAVPVPAGQPLNATVGSSVLLTVSGGAPAPGSTTSNSAVLAPAPGVDGGFVAVSPGTATLTAPASIATGNVPVSSTVTVVAYSTGTSGVGAVRRPPLSMLFGIMPRRLAA